MAPESCILRPLKPPDTAAEGEDDLPEAPEGTDFEPETNSSARLEPAEGEPRTIQSTNCKARATWAAASFNWLYLTSDEVNRERAGFRRTSDKTLFVIPPREVSDEQMKSRMA